MRVPKVFRHLSRRVLTIDWIVGESPRDLLFLSIEPVDHHSIHQERGQKEAKKRLLDMVNRGVEASLIQFLETGLLHTIHILEICAIYLQEKLDFLILACFVGWKRNISFPCLRQLCT